MEGLTILVTLLILSSLASANIPETGRIKGGQVSWRGERPFQGLAILSRADDPTDSTICSVVLVEANWALAPSACKLAEGTEIFFGLNNWCHRGYYQYDAGYEQRTVKRIITRERTEETPKNMRYPLILAQLSSPVNEKADRIQYAILAKEHPKSTVLYSVSGWGQTEEYGPMSCQLRLAAADVLSDEACKTAQSKKLLPGDQVCVYTEKNSQAGCNGDIGSPLVQINVVYGVMSKNTGCGFSTYPQLFDTIDTEKDWIRDTIKQQTGGSVRIIA